MNAELNQYIVHTSANAGIHESDSFYSSVEYPTGEGPLATLSSISSQISRLTERWIPAKGTLE